METSINQSKSAACSSYLQELDVLRHRRPKIDDFSKLPLGPEIQERIVQETNQEIDDLNGRCRLEDSDSSDQEAEDIKHRVCAKYKDRVFEFRIKLALFTESERLLRILRTRGFGPGLDESTLKQRQTEYIQQLDLGFFPEAKPKSPLYLGADPSQDEGDASSSHPDVKLPPTAIGPNDYFEATCPDLVANFGYPFHISIQQKLVGINTDFFGAYLAGERRFMHDVIFYVPESRFYFFDPMSRQYIPTSEDKMRIWLSLILQERAWGNYMDHATTILTQFRGPDVVDEILGKAKSLLAAERGFFEGNKSHPRFVVEDSNMKNLQFSVRLFMEAKVCLDERGILTITDFMDGLKHYLRERGTSLPKPQELKTIVQETIRQTHGKGFRNDLVLADNRCVAGWKGLRLDNHELQRTNHSGNELEIRQSGDSELSDPVPDLEVATVPSPDVALLS